MNEMENLEKILPFSKTLNILFVEDNKEVSEQIQKMLENFFDKIDLAFDGEEALKLYNENFYDIVITDLSMPKLDGISLCKEIMKQNENQIILVISAYTHPNDLHDLINIGVSKFIQKPINTKDIIETLTNTINLCKNGNSRY